MPFRLIEKPLKVPPYACLVTNRADGELIDFDADVCGVDPHVYLKRTVVEKAATELLNMAPASHLREAELENRKLTARVEHLEEMLEASEQIKRLEDTLKEKVTVNG